jgi:diamine N-acetyltransferase
VPPFEYRITDIHEIELIRPLWTRLNEYHHGRATTFRYHYEQWTFDDRKKYFEKIALAGSLRLDLVSDANTGRYVGYCISYISQEKTGEIESIFVEERYRSQGVGSTLVTRALAWLGENGSVRNRVSVGQGNEAAWEFYRKFRFYPRMTVLEQKKE